MRWRVAGAAATRRAIWAAVVGACDASRCSGTCGARDATVSPAMLHAMPACCSARGERDQGFGPTRHEHGGRWPGYSVRTRGRCANLVLGTTQPGRCAARQYRNPYPVSVVCIWQGPLRRSDVGRPAPPVSCASRLASVTDLAPSTRKHPRRRSQRRSRATWQLAVRERAALQARTLSARFRPVRRSWHAMGPRRRCRRSAHQLLDALGHTSTTDGSPLRSAPRTRTFATTWCLTAVPLTQVLLCARCSLL